MPWTDRKGRPNLMRGVVFTLLLMPGLWLGLRWGIVGLGAEPAKTAIHSTGFWTIWLLLASLVVTPLRALSGVPNVVVVRRMLGNAALCYGLAHLLLYCVDENWRWGTIVSEIVSRFYLLIGFVALAGLCVLGLTSTDGWIWWMGKAWKRLHRVAYGIAVLGLVHYVLQSKLDVSQSLVAAGVFGWLMAWRVLPSGRDRSWLPLLGLSVVAAGLTLGCEWGWYRFGTRIDPVRVVRGELDLGAGLHPAGQVLALGLLATAGLQAWRWRQTEWGAGLLFTAGLYALGAFAGSGAGFFLGWFPDDPVVPLPAWWVQLLGWLVLLGGLGAVRWVLRGRWTARLVDVAWLAGVMFQLGLAESGSLDPGPAVAVLLGGWPLVGTARLWTVSRPAALALAPLGVVLAYGAVALL